MLIHTADTLYQLPNFIYYFSIEYAIRSRSCKIYINFQFQQKFDELHMSNFIEENWSGFLYFEFLPGRLLSNNRTGWKCTALIKSRVLIKQAKKSKLLIWPISATHIILLAAFLLLGLLYESFICKTQIYCSSIC